MYRMRSFPGERVPNNDELFERVVERTLALDAMFHPALDADACAALVDYVHAQLAAVSLLCAVFRP